jgi:hypothetical protein
MDSVEQQVTDKLQEAYLFVWGDYPPDSDDEGLLKLLAREGGALRARLAGGG